MVRRVLMTAMVGALAIGALPQATRATAAPMFAPPRHYYVALGDSYAFGFQLAKAMAAGPNVYAAMFNTGYVDDFGAMLATLRPDIQTMNFSCQSSSSTEAITTSGCGSRLAHISYSGSQLNAAVAFLQAHPGQVSPITVDLGGDDVLYLVESCGGFTTAAVACVQSQLPSVLAQAGANLNQILGALRQAAPSAEIIAVQYYNPLAVEPSLAAPSTKIIQALNSVIAQAAVANGAILADTFTPFNLAPDEPATLCRFTGICTPLQDIHPSDAGYAAIAQQVWNASGYGKLAGQFVVGFDSAQPGDGRVYFGSGPGCLGLVEVGTKDLHPGTTTHAVVVTGNDLPGTVGDNGIGPGTTYWYETATGTTSGEQINNNGGKCYSMTIPAR